MALSTRIFIFCSSKIKSTFVPVRYTNMVQPWLLERQRKNILNRERIRDDEEQYEDDINVSVNEYKNIYPDFLPDSVWYYRDSIREKLERKDMLRRRNVINIPEFYVGSILAVTVSDPNAPGKQNRFVGICIDRGGHGLRHFFILRNSVEGLGVEISYDMYNPAIQKIEVLKLEKRLDKELYYLRDSPIEHSTIPFDMDAILHPRGAPVPVNKIKVKLNPKPWLCRWERFNLLGIQELDLPQKVLDKSKRVAQPWEKYDIMKRYRETINDDDLAEVHKDFFRQKASLRKGK